MFTIPRAIPENKNLFRITLFGGYAGITVTAQCEEKNEAGEKTGKVIRWKMNELSGAHLKVVPVEGGFSVEYYGSPYLYNAPKNGSMSCSCPRVVLKGAYKTPKEAIWAGIMAKQQEDDLRWKGDRTLPAAGTLPATPVRSGENDWNNARYDA
jgi:hypothetical protein